MAKELGMKPKSLLKNIPSAKQQWKASVKIWIRDLYEKKFGYVLTPEKKKQPRRTETNIFSDQELPF